MWVNLTTAQIAAILSVVDDDEISGSLRRGDHHDAARLEAAAGRLFEDDEVSPGTLAERTVNSGYVAGVFWITNEQAGIYVDPTKLRVSDQTRARLNEHKCLRIQEILLYGHDVAKGVLGEFQWELAFDHKRWEFDINDSATKIGWSYCEPWPKPLCRDEMPHENDHELVVVSLLRAIELYNQGRNLAQW